MSQIQREPARLLEGQTIENFGFTTPFKSNASLYETIGEKPTFLLFLRYYGCTLCQYDIHLLTEGYEKFVMAGANLLVVLQSDPGKLAEKLEGKVPPFEIICDPDQTLYKAYDIKPAENQMKMASPAVMVKVAKAKAMGFSHGEYEGEELQLPALFLVKPDHSVAYARYAKNLGDLPDVEEMIELL